jgi:hypothetical protein
VLVEAVRLIVEAMRDIEIALVVVSMLEDLRLLI